jgi:hypothetical protein
MVLRRDMRVTAPIVVYSRGDVTTGFQAFGELAGVMTSADQLVVACAAEVAIARHLFTGFLRQTFLGERSHVYRDR